MSQTTVRAQAAKATVQPARAAAPSQSGLLQRKCACGGAAGLDGECTECREKRLTVQRSAAGPAPEGVPPIVHDVLRSPGQPLDFATRAYMEPRFGHDFSHVRVHADGLAAESAHAVNALAYTVGSDVVFGSGQYNPIRTGGYRLIAHELTHVIQQSHGLTGSLPDVTHEREAEAAGQAIAYRGAKVAVNGASGTGIARAPAGQSGAVSPKVTPEIEQRLVQELLDARINAPPAGSIRREANRTFATAAIIKPDGQVEYVTAYFDEGMALHAEPQLLNQIQGRVQENDMVAIAVDQVPCDPTKANCELVLKDFARNPRNGSLRVFTVRALRRDTPPGVTPKAAGPENLVRPKTAIQRPIEERFLFEEKEFRRIRLPLYREPAVKPSSPGAGGEPAGSAGGEPPASIKPPSGGAGAEPPVSIEPPVSVKPTVAPGTGGAEGTPRPVVRPGPGGIGRAAVNLAKLVGPAVLDAINRYYMAKAESERAVKLIESKIRSSDVETRISDLVEKERLSIARKQLRSARVYVTVALQLSFSNDVLNTLSLNRVYLGDSDESNFVSVVMSHDLLAGVENKVWYVDVSLLVGPMELSRSEDIKLRLEVLEEQGSSPSTMDPETLARLSEERNRLLSEQPKAEKEEAEARQKEIDRPAVIADPKKRTQQQAQLAEQLHQLAEKRKSAAAEPKKAEGPSQPPGQSLLPSAPPPAMSFLPGVPGLDPIKEAARVVNNAGVWANRLVQLGTALLDRISAGVDSPTPAERQAFLDEEKQWRFAVKFMMNKFHENSREEAVNGLGELLDRLGPRLAQMRSQLGGE